MNAEERRKVKERVARHRERKAEAAEIAQEQAEQHQARVAKYGEQKTKNYYIANGYAEFAAGLLMLFKNEPQTSTNITPDEISEVIGAIDEWSQTYEPDYALHENWQRGMQMGFWPAPKDAIHYFHRLYQLSLITCPAAYRIARNLRPIAIGHARWRSTR